MARILILDDDKDILEIMQLILTTNGFEVEVSDNGEEACIKTEAVKPDLILLDVYLAGNDGRKICDRLKTNKKTKKVPVIMVSAYADREETLDVCDAEDFISKPFDIGELINKIKFHLKLTHAVV